MKFIIVFFTFFIANIAPAMAQPTYPSINHPMPAMNLELRVGMSGKKSLTDLTDKPLILYFFGKGCVGSFMQLQELNQIYIKYKSKMNLILVGMDLNDGIKESYDLFRDRLNLKLPVAYDSIYYKKFNVVAVPHAIWINKRGVVKAITSNINEEDVKAFIKGNSFEFVNTSWEAKVNKPRFQYDKPFLVDNNGGAVKDFEYRSILTTWKPGMPVHTIGTSAYGSHPLEQVTFLQLIGRELTELYRVAYWGRSFPWGIRDTVMYGKYSWEIILELNDSSNFFSTSLNESIRYCYSQTLPIEKRNPERMMRTMQSDLRNYFGYEVSVEKRKMPYLRLVADQYAAKRLMVNPKKGIMTADDITGGDFNNIDINVLIEVISHTCQLPIKNIALINESGIHGKIDISFKAVMTDLEDVRKGLRKNGLDILCGEREMNVMILREPLGGKVIVP